MGLISNFPQNKKLPELNNPATADMIMEGYEAIDNNKQKITGSFTLVAEKNEQDELIAQIKEALAGKTLPSESITLVNNMLIIK